MERSNNRREDIIIELQKELNINELHTSKFNAFRDFLEDLTKRVKDTPADNFQEQVEKDGYLTFLDAILKEYKKVIGGE